MLQHIFYLAPMEGVTTCIFRNALEKYFPGTDCYFTSFIAPNQKGDLSKRDLKDVDPKNNHVKRLVPQILTNRPDSFNGAVKKLHSLGYEEVNLNLGCPSGTVTARGRGAGFLAHPKELDQFLEQIFSQNTVKISIKTRIGMEKPEEIYELIRIFNQYPISELIIHPRTRQEFYRGEPHIDVFEDVLGLCAMPVCYNGNLLTRQRFDDFRDRFSGDTPVSRVMIGRGAIVNPGLIREVKDSENNEEVRHLKKEELRSFHDEVFTLYRENCGGDANAISRMKELWVYLLHAFEDAQKPGKKIRKSKSAEEYLFAVDQVFRLCELKVGG